MFIGLSRGEDEGAWMCACAVGSIAYYVIKNVRTPNKIKLRFVPPKVMA